MTLNFNTGLSSADSRDLQFGAVFWLSFRGTFSVIRRCIDKKTNKVCAVKIVDVGKMTSSCGLTESGRTVLKSNTA
jgi:hypothetical protein